MHIGALMKLTVRLIDSSFVLPPSLPLSLASRLPKGTPKPLATVSRFPSYMRLLDPSMLLPRLLYIIETLDHAPPLVFDCGEVWT